MNKNITNKFSFILAGMVSIASVGLNPQAVWAKSKSQIAQMAIPVTVQINSATGGGGTGVIINQQAEADGTIYTVLTANHVVADKRNVYQVKTHTGDLYQVVAIESYLKNQEKDPDLAIIKFKTKDYYPSANLGDSSQESFGSEIAIFGYPYLDENQQAEERPFVYSPGELNNPQGRRPNGYDWLYNAVTQKGMSGGPVFDSEGEVVAIHGRGEKFQDKAAFNAGIPINTFVALEPNMVERNAIAMNPSSNPYESGQTPKTLETAYQKTDRYAGASHFYCDLSGEIPKTMARNVLNGQELTLIEWKDDPNFQWSVTKEERCKIVSGRFQRAYYENRLDYLKTGESAGLPVVCGVEFEDQACTADQVLVTFQPKTNADQWLDGFLQGQTMTVRGAKTGVKNMRMLLSPLTEE